MERIDAENKVEGLLRKRQRIGRAFTVQEQTIVLCHERRCLGAVLRAQYDDFAESAASRREPRLQRG